MSKDDIVYLLMILNVNTYANVILERSLRANEGRVGVNESILTVMKQIWTQMNVYFLEMNSKRCTQTKNVITFACCLSIYLIKRLSSVCNIPFIHMTNYKVIYS